MVAEPQPTWRKTAHSTGNSSNAAIGLPTRECRTAMCDKCVELDSKIDHYRFLADRITDQLTIDGIKQLIERMQAEKAALHPEQTE
jgi:hypothetical protein